MSPQHMLRHAAHAAASLDAGCRVHVCVCAGSLISWFPELPAHKIHVMFKTKGEWPRAGRDDAMMI